MNITVHPAGVLIHSFVDGTRVARPKPRETEADALAYALWLEGHGKREEAEQYLEEYLQRTSGATRH
jgi:hypothetical protein